MDKTGLFNQEQICYSLAGKGKCIVLLHGFLGSKWVWEKYIQALSNTYLVLSIDLPGHGNSSCSKDHYSMQQLADIVFEVLQHEQIESCHLVGHSMGGYISLALGQQHPQLVQSIILINSNARADSEKKRKERTLAARVFDMNPSVFLEAAMNHLFLTPVHSSIQATKSEVIKIAHSTSNHGAKACLLGIRDREDLLDWHILNSTAVLYLSSVNDTTIPFEIIEEQVRLGDFELVPLKQSNHMSMIEEFELCLSSIEIFLEKQT